MIDDLKAKKISSQWYAGQFSPLYKLCSSGYVDNVTINEIEDCIESEDYCDNDLIDLKEYVNDRIVNNINVSIDYWDTLNW